MPATKLPTARVVDARLLVAIECPSCHKVSLFQYTRFTESRSDDPRCSDQECNMPLVLSQDEKSKLPHYTFVDDGFRVRFCSPTDTSSQST
jgi:hypothetical protein